MMKYCCDIMEFELKKDKTIIEYELHTRSFDLIAHKSPYGTHQQILYCPWCGKKLPKDLNEEWCKVIKEELGIEDVSAKEWATLPEEYKTDEWCRKRGL